MKKKKKRDKAKDKMIARDAEVLWQEGARVQVLDSKGRLRDGLMIHPGNVVQSGAVPSRIERLLDAAKSLEDWLNDHRCVMEKFDVDEVEAQIKEVRRTAKDLEAFAIAFQRLL